MKKTLFIISSLFFIGCANSNDLINSEVEEQNLKTKDGLSSMSSRMSALNGGEALLMDIEIASSIQVSSGGCPYEDEVIDGFYVTTRAFGPNPIEQYGYQIRGYGRPNKSSAWKGIRLQNSNRPKTISSSRGQTTIINDPTSSAISIEFPFEGNATYQIILTSWFEDSIYETKHNEFHLDDDRYDINKSEGFPTVGIELSNSPEIKGVDPCAERPFVQPSGFLNRNYHKEQKIILTKPLSDLKELTYNFSITEPKNAMIIYFMPERSENRISDYIPKNVFTMFLYKIKVIKKPFDPSHVVPPRVTTPDPDLPCGFRGGC